MGFVVTASRLRSGGVVFGSISHIFFLQFIGDECFGLTTNFLGLQHDRLSLLGCIDGAVQHLQLLAQHVVFHTEDDQADGQRDDDDCFDEFFIHWRVS